MSMSAAYIETSNRSPRIIPMPACLRVAGGLGMGMGMEYLFNFVASASEDLGWAFFCYTRRKLPTHWQITL